MSKSAWRFFPLAIGAFLVTVVAVDGSMIWAAVHSFPGAADEHAFNTGNQYNEILDSAARQAALGWRLDVKASSRNVEVTLLDQDGAILSGAHIEAIAAHPVGPASSTNLEFSPQGEIYVAKNALPGPGQWDLGLTASLGDVKYRATRRIIIQ